ncbi:MAG: acyl-CoA dehydrogenase family protein [Promethearchaeia archaeon]
MKEKIINDKILEHMTLENVYNILNDNIFPMLNEEERAYCRELEDFCLELHPKIDKNKSVYGVFPELGKGGWIQRINKFQDFTPYGMKKEVLLGTIMSCCDPQLELARLASGILCGNPTFQHGETDEILKVQEELMTGEAVGCICITEPDRGSDAVHMTTECTKNDNGSVTFNGEKVYTTNGPKADYFATYGVYDVEKPRKTMVQAMLSRDFGVKTNRLDISAVPRVHIAHTILDDVTAPKEYILGDNGGGYRNLFDGLVPERLGIMGSGVGICWGALAYGIIYANLREQFGQKIINFEGVGFSIADLLSKTTAATSLALEAADIYDEKILFSDTVSKDAEKWVAAISSRGKYFLSKLTHEVCYEIQQACGGITVTDNTPIDEFMDTSKIEEVIGGARNIQLYVIQGALRKYLHMF